MKWYRMGYYNKDGWVTLRAAFRLPDNDEMTPLRNYGRSRYISRPEPLGMPPTRSVEIPIWPDLER